MLGTENHKTPFHSLSAGVKSSINPLGGKPFIKEAISKFFLFSSNTRIWKVHYCLFRAELGKLDYVWGGGAGREGENRFCKKHILHAELPYNTSTGH